jgi:hypothetical protein
MRGQADDRVRPQQASDGGWRQIVLSDVHTCRAGNPRDIDAVVDDDRGAIGRGDPDGRVAEVEQRSGLELLGADLDEGGAAVEERTQEIERCVAGACRGVDVDDGVKRTQRASPLSAWA